MDNLNAHTLTSQVWLSRLTAAVLRPMIMANAEFKFLWVLQLQIQNILSKDVCKDILGYYTRCVVLLSSDLDELLEQLHSLAERYAHENFRHDPLLDLVAALEEDRECRCVTRAGRMAERVVRQFLLHMDREKKKKKELLMHFSKLFLCYWIPTLLFFGVQIQVQGSGLGIFISEGLWFE